MTLLSLILTKTKKQMYLSFVFLLGMLAVIFTKSRGALIVMIAGIMMTAGTSVLIKPTAQKFKLLLVGIFVLMILGGITAPKIISRFKKAPKASAETRHYFNQAAKAMANDHTFGIGINSYSWTLANTQYYWFVYPDIEESRRDEFRDGPNSGSRLGNCHHIYLLWAAECGWITMWIFIIFISRFYLFNIKLIFSKKDVYLKSILIGLLAGFTTLHVQGLLEWIFRQTQVMYLFYCLCGLLSAISLHISNPKESENQNKKNEKIIPSPSLLLKRKEIHENLKLKRKKLHQ